MGCHWNATSLPLVLSPKPVEKEGGKRCSAQGAQGEHPRTPPGRSCWECRGSGMLCSRPFLPKSNPTQIRERWCSTTCLRCFWKMLGALEARSFCLENFRAPAPWGLAGNPSREFRQRGGRVRSRGDLGGDEEDLGCHKSSAPLWDCHCTARHRRPCPVPGFWGGKTEISPVLGLGGGFVPTAEEAELGMAEEAAATNPG